MVSYTLTTVVLAWADPIDPQLVLPLGLGLYVAKFTLLGVVMVAVGVDRLGRADPALPRASSPGVVVWTAVHIWWLTTVARPSTARLTWRSTGRPIQRTRARTCRRVRSFSRRAEGE